MKKSFLLLLSILSISFAAVAKPVDKNDAIQVALHYLQAATGRNYTNLVDLTDQTPFQGFYTFALSDEGGFVLVSADDCVLPILGYSEQSQFDPRDIPPHVMEWMHGYDEQIAFYREHYGELDYGGSTEIRSQWESLLQGRIVGPQYTAVSPMLSTTWGQNPYYNDLCPMDYASNVRTVTGCVATAAAQIMKFWEYPATGVGSHSYTHPLYGTFDADFGNATYNWAGMPAALSSSSSPTQVNAIATLMYHIGVAVEMNYGTSANGGSGAQTFSAGNYYRPSVEVALACYFKYSPTLHAIHYGDFTHDEWCGALRDELDAGRPILYTGFDASGGHAFVLDGYSEQGQFHVNWGWNGSYDGYFSIGDLHPGAGGTGGNVTYTFNLHNSALVGIEPLTSWNPSSSTTVNLSTSNTQYGNAFQINETGNYSFGDTIYFWVYANEGCRFSGWDDGCTDNPRQMIARGGTINLTANVVPLVGDTLGYCTGNGHFSYGSAYDDEDWYWGIRLPASVLPDDEELRAVEMYVSYSGLYTVSIYSGTTHSGYPDTLMPGTHLYSQTYYASNVMRWNTITLSSPVAVDNTQDVWIIIHNYGIPYPTSLSTGWGGNDDGSYVGYSLTELESIGSYSVTVRGIFGTEPEPPQMVGITLAVNDASMGSINPTPGTYEYPVGSSFSVTATPHYGYVMTGWRATVSYYGDTTAYDMVLASDDPEFANPIVFDVSEDYLEFSSITITALFEVDPELPATLNIRINNSAMGYVLINGRAENSYTGVIGEQVNVEAIAYSGYSFQRWSDGVADAVRTIELEEPVTNLRAIFEQSTAIANPQLSADDYRLSVFPNPTSDIVTISVNTDGFDASGNVETLLSETAVDVFDLNGRKVVTLGSSQPSATNSRITIDLGGLCSGTYILHVQTGSGTILKKVVKK